MLQVQGADDASLKVGLLSSSDEAAMVDMNVTSNIDKIVLTLEHVSYTVKKKQILNDVSAQFLPNEIVALMGGSGSGKTTLLSVIGARAAGIVEGQVLANNTPVTRDILKYYAAYIPQDDILIAALTPRETLMYAAELRLSSSFSVDEKMHRVNALLDDISLTDCADVAIGDAQIRGISGGQRKRVSIAVELIINPVVLFADEPTSGLDSKTACTVVQLLRDIAHRGRTVVVSLHQPSKKIFHLFDKLLLLQQGRIVFFGGVKESQAYFSSLGYPVPAHDNPPNFYLETLQIKLGGRTFGDCWEQGRGSFEPPHVGCAGLPPLEGNDNLYQTSTLKQVVTLASRSYYLTVRDPRMFVTRFLSTIAATIVTSFIFPQVGNDQMSAHDITALMILASMYIGMDGCVQQAIVFPLEKMVVVREFSNGAYRLPTYYVSRWVTSFAFQVVYTLVFCAGLYIICGLRTGLAHFCVFFLVMVLMGAFIVGFGFGIGAVAQSVMMANVMITPQFLALIMMNGFLIPRHKIPVYYIWMYWINPLNFSFQAMAINQFKDMSFDNCTSAVGEPCPYGEGVQSGGVLLHQFSIPEHNMSLALGLQVAFAGAMFLGGYRLLAWAVNKTKF